MNALKTVVVGLDPGSGSSSPTGFVAIEPESMSLLYSSQLWSKEKEQSRRLRDLHDQAYDLMHSIDPDVELQVYVESFFIRGRGNQVLQQVIGALKAAAPEHAHLDDVANTTMKKYVGGSGKADKPQVAAGVYKLMSKNSESAAAIRELIEEGDWDVIDAAGIALAGWLRNQESKCKTKTSRTSGT